MGRHGENIRLRSDGRWEARVFVADQTSGGKRYKYLYGKSYQEVKQRRDDFLRGNVFAYQRLPAIPAASKAQLPPEVTFGTVAADWLAAKRPMVKESTYIHYARQVERHLLPEFESMSPAEIDSVRIETFLTRKKQSGSLAGHTPLSANSLADIKLILMQILKYAKAHGLILMVPDCPATPFIQRPVIVLSREEQETLVCYILAHETVFTLGILVALYAGLRIGEVCALKWSDFNLTSGTVTVSRTVMRIYDADGDDSAKTKVLIDKPKTISSLRTIPLTEDLIFYLSSRQGGDDTFVITGTDKCMEPRVCLDRYKRLLRRAGLPDYNFHLLRHTFATRCVEQGVDMKSLSEIMGHANVSVTLQRYVHPSMELKRKQINKINEPALRGQNSWSE